MSGKPGKSGGARSGSGRPRIASKKVRVQFNLSREAAAVFRAVIAPTERSKWLEGVILERF